MYLEIKSSGFYFKNHSDSARVSRVLFKITDLKSKLLL